VPPDSVWCTTRQCPVHQRTPSQTHHLRENREALRYNSPDCPVYTGQCPVPQGRAALELACFGNLLRYNSPDCPVYTGLSGEPAKQRLVRANGHLQTHLMRARARRSQARARWHTGHSTVHVRCATGHPGGPRRQSSNGRIPTTLVTWLAHRTCPVYTGLSGAPYDRQPHQTASLVVGAINTPTTPPFMASKFSSFQPLTRASHSIQDTPK
jgi:hypothetical protein